MLRSVLRSFTLSRAFVVICAGLGYYLIPSVHEGISIPLTEQAPRFVSMWYQWDANWYMSIISGGYQWVPGDQSNVAFFPLYPLLTWLGGFILAKRFLISGLMLSTACLLASMFLLYRLVLDDYGHDIARRAVWLLAIFPTSFFFNAFYTESLFLLTSLASFYYARKGRWAAAGIWGLLASLTRITGLWLILPLLWELLSQKNFSWRKAVPSAAWLSLLPAGTGLYMLYLFTGFGEPLGFVETQSSGWGHGFTSIWTSLSRDLSFLTAQSEGWVIYEFAALALMLACIAGGLKKLRGSYNIYMFLSLLVPLLGGTTKSLSRYMLAAFPVFIVMAMYTKRPAVRYSVYAVSLALLAAGAIAFVTGRWVA